MKKELPIPEHFDKENAKLWDYRIDIPKLYQDAAEYQEKNAVKAAANESKRVDLLIIDPQKDFTQPEGSLFVAGQTGMGAVEDNIRLAEFIYKNLNSVTNITTTLDTHIPYQIFFGLFWLDENDQHPAPGTAIVAEDIRTGKYRPNPALVKILGVDYNWLLKQVLFYTEELEKAGKFVLLIWPNHTMLGSQGHAVNDAIYEAVTFHSVARKVQPGIEVKGGNPLTENYSVLRPEVTKTHDGQVIAQKNVNFIKRLFEAHAVIIAGQAKSHCVAWTIDDLLNEIYAQNPKLVKKIYLLEDCSSPVVIPGILDFTKEADEAFERFQNAGMNVVRSTDPIEDWLKI